VVKFTARRQPKIANARKVSSIGFNFERLDSILKPAKLLALKSWITDIGLWIF